MMVEELKIFEDPEELNLILSGPQFIDVEDWRKNTVYSEIGNMDEKLDLEEGGEIIEKNFQDLHPYAEHFWMILGTFSQSELRTFLQFCTGS